MNTVKLLTVHLKTKLGGPTVVEIPISRDELIDARIDFTEWVGDKATGPLDGSWGSLMDWWMSERRPEWKKFDVVDRIHLKYAVGTLHIRVGGSRLECDVRGDVCVKHQQPVSVCRYEEGA